MKIFRKLVCEWIFFVLVDQYSPEVQNHIRERHLYQRPHYTSLHGFSKDLHRTYRRKTLCHTHLLAQNKHLSRIRVCLRLML